MKLPTGLPHLEGTRSRVVSWIFIVVTAYAVVLTIGGTVFTAIDYFRNIPADSAYGFRTITLEHGGNTIYGVSPAASRAGLRTRDQIIAIDGEPILPATTENEIGARMTSKGDNVTLTVRTGHAPARAVDLHKIKGSVWSEPDVVSGMPLWLSSLLPYLEYSVGSWLLLGSALLLFLRRRHDSGAMAFALAFSLMAFNPSSTFWLAPYVPPMLSLNLPFALKFTGLALFIVAIAGFPDGRFHTLAARLVPLLVLPHLSLGWALVIIAPNATTAPDWLVSVLPFTAPIAVFGLVGAIGAQVLRYRRGSLTPIERQQYKWVMLAFVITAAAVLVQVALFLSGADQHDPMISGPLQVASLLLQIVPPLGILISLVRHRLYDAESAISRSVAYGALTVALLAIFAGSERIIELMGEEYFGHSIGLLAGGLGAAIAAVMVAPIHHRVSDWAERRFQKDLLDLRRGLPVALTDLRETANLDQLGDAVLSAAAKGVRATYGAILVGDEIGTRDVPIERATAWLNAWTPAGTGELETVTSDTLFPLRVPLVANGTGIAGWLLLGPRPDGSLYGKDEREALAEIAAPVARAIAVTRQRLAWRQEQASVTAFLADRIERLEAALARLAEDGRASAAQQA